MSTMLWQPTTSATISHTYRNILNEWYNKTVEENNDFLNDVAFQGHDFSMRGMSSLETVKTSGAGHLLNFVGTDSIPGILYLEKNYNSNIENEMIGTSISATEHSVQCAYGQEKEFETYKRLINEVYPNGLVSIVSDTWDLWNVINNYLPRLHEDIMKRDGKIVIRPDSGEPIDILCGNPNGKTESERKGVIELLWEQFGGTITKQGYKVLDSHIGAIYGDAITLQKCNEICTRLAKKGFASINVVFGIGSFSFAYNTRDTFGFALKSTYAVIGGEENFLFKNPVTDNGVKKSQRGRVYVYRNNLNNLVYRDELDMKSSKEFENSNLLRPLFEDGKLLRETSLQEIRNRIIEA